jgi:hypothetical protein
MCFQMPLRAEPNLANQIRLMLSVQPSLRKYSCSRLTRLESISMASRPTQKGRIAIVTDAGRDVVDAAASGAQVNGRAGSGLSQACERSNCAQTNGVVAYGKTAWFRHPLLVPSCRWRNRSNRIRSAIKPAATVTRRIRSPGRARYKP